MKKLLSLSLIFSLILALITPGLSLAHDLNQDELDEYLEEAQVTEKELVTHLTDFYQMSLYDFESVDELAEMLGYRLTTEDVNNIVAELADVYGVTSEDAFAYLDEWFEGMSPLDFVFYNTFYWIVDFILYIETEEDYYYPDFEGFLKEFSLSYEEEFRLYDHFWYISENNPHLASDLEDLKNRAYQFDGFESIRELNAADVAELFAIGQKAIDVLDLHPEFFLDKVGEDPKPITFETLMSGNAIKGYDLLVKLYDADGQFLADFYITAEMFNSHFVKKVVDDVNNIGKEVEDAKNKKPSLDDIDLSDKQSPSSGGSDTNGNDNTQSGKLTKTVDGAKMPKTASDYPLYMMLGLGLMVVGAVVFRRVLREKKAA
ncbi:processed acidic surface protein [Alkalihalobacillus xiaoxiensis]|uniref:Processed acidic surface protein n=1 Tax=Shouchella xiaoxiensis TaxID=766895 RepID=A0ABS2SYJ9_9BACI|nr:processed acidic surface protein [Shouchella xiaoxiensis]MBM7840603.1 processed acidic surface protein [Shouchella xiaoxiensis]